MVGAWHGHGMASVNQTRPHCVNQMGKTHSKPLAARNGRGTAWAQHAMCESAFILFYKVCNLSLNWPLWEDISLQHIEDNYFGWASCQSQFMKLNFAQM